MIGTETGRAVAPPARPPIARGPRGRTRRLARLYMASPLAARLAARPWARPVLWRAEALVLRLFWAVCRRLPPDRASALGGAIGARVGPRLAKSRHVRANFRTIFPHKDARAIDDLARAMWRSVGRTLGEFPHLGTIAREPERIEVVIRSPIRALEPGGPPAIFLAAHQANWEILTMSAARRLGLTFNVLYSPQRNPFVHALVQAERRELGVRKMIPRDGGISTMLRELAAGYPIGMMTDQRVDGGEMLPFFGRGAATAVAPELIAVRRGCEVVPVRVERTRGARFRVTYHEPLDPHPEIADPRERARRMAQQLNGLFEDWIRERPWEWQCAKRRWPKERRRSSETAAPRPAPTAPAGLDRPAARDQD